MKSTLIIKDLALDKELGGKAMSAVRGGSAVNQSFAPQTINFGGKVCESPVTIVGPITTQSAVDMSKVGSWNPCPPQPEHCNPCDDYSSSKKYY
jgi:hypothetical protein